MSIWQPAASVLKGRKIASGVTSKGRTASLKDEKQALDDGILKFCKMLVQNFCQILVVFVQGTEKTGWQKDKCVSPQLPEISRPNGEPILRRFTSLHLTQLQPQQL
jgi:hypothetical protein